MDSNVHNPDILGQTYPVRRIKHYSNFHKILLVGEGDFSFSSALANAFGFAGNMVATSLDSREKVVSSYKSSPEKPCKSGQENLQTLERLGAMTLHGVDVTTMDKLDSLRERKFDRIVYNFPHAGFFGKEEDEKLLNKHRHLVKMFFKNARPMLSTKGEIHVTHQERYPYNQWKLTEQAEECGLQLKESVKFRKSDYQGYTNRRGAGPNIGDTFGFGHCRTYMYIQRESMGPIVPLPKLSSKAHAESLEAELLEAAILELESERQARKASETAKVEMEASINYLKAADKALEGNIAKQLSLKKDEIKITLLKLDIERQARKAAETAKSELEASFNNFKLSAIRQMNQLERQRNDALYQKEDVCREKVKIAKQLDEVLTLQKDAKGKKDTILRERNDPIQSKWKSYWRWIWTCGFNFEDCDETHPLLTRHQPYN